MNLTHGGDLFAISRARGWDWREVADFSASVNPLGPAPGVADAIRHAIGRIAHYPEREPARLRAALAELWNVSEHQILLGNGAAELIHFFARVEPAETASLPVPAFSEIHRAFPQAISTANWHAQGLVVLTQPVNPTGAAIDPEKLERWLKGTANPVLIDESFLDFTALPSAMRLVEARRNLFVLRSLTKFYALPGLRIGALVASRETIARWRDRREPWQVNVLAEAAALAAIADREHAQRTLAFVAERRAAMMDELASLRGVDTMPSVANYVFCALDYSSATLCDHLIEHKILIRDCTGWPGVHGEGVRIAVRPAHEFERLMTAWKQFR
jgi:threonine-phosphate decarboxylase